MTTTTTVIIDAVVMYVAIEISVAALLLDDFAFLFGMKRRTVKLIAALAITLWAYVIIDVVIGVYLIVKRIN